jgi:hypothetical protein
MMKVYIKGESGINVSSLSLVLYNINMRKVVEAIVGGCNRQKLRTKNFTINFSIVY